MNSKRHQEQLEELVQERTAELKRVAERLRQEIAERKKIEAELREKTERLTRAERVSRVGFLDWNLRTNEIIWSDYLFELYGVDPSVESPSIESTLQLVHSDDLEHVQENLDLAIHGLQEYNIDHRIVRPDGKVIWVHVHAELVRGADGAAENLLGTVVDITRRKRIEQALRASERRLATRIQIASIFLTVSDDAMYGDVLAIILDALDSPYGVFGFLDEDGALVVPTMTREIWDKYQVPDKSIVFARETWGNSTWPRCIREKRMIYSNEPSTLTPKGHIPVSRHISMPILYEGEPIGLFQVANKATPYDENDIQRLYSIADQVAPILNARLQRDRQTRQRIQTETALRQSDRKLLEHQQQETQHVQSELDRTRQELVKQAKLATIGQMSAQVAHDIRNPLGAVRNAAYYLTHKIPSHETKCQEYLHLIQHEIDVCSQIIDHLLQATQDKPPRRESLNLRNFLDKILSQVDRPSGVSFCLAFEPDPFSLDIDPLQFRQVFDNLIKNALDAVDEYGTISIQAERTVDGDFITVKDNGTGIVPEVRDSVFEPFFTTKAQGTGLGLVICRQIIERHDGTIQLLEEQNEGAVFQICLPRQDA